MIVLIEGSLSEPPSSVYCFRDLTLYADVFLDADVLVECDKESIDLYWEWLTRRCAMDFIRDILSFGEEEGIRIGSGEIEIANILINKIDEYSLNGVISRLNAFKN
tara:strand:+ start:13807 stop:14124 length:318 start_codon:yes stop_codon:yes gene_type:complete